VTPKAAPLRENLDIAPLPRVDGGFKTVLADPPWRFQNRTGKVAPEHRRLDRYSTMSLEEIKSLPVSEVVSDNAHLYLWVPNALLPEGLQVMEAWGFRYVSNIVWAKRRKDGGPDGRGVGFYFRNVTELILIKRLKVRLLLVQLKSFCQGVFAKFEDWQRNIQLLFHKGICHLGIAFEELHFGNECASIRRFI